MKIEKPGMVLSPDHSTVAEQCTAAPATAGGRGLGLAARVRCWPSPPPAHGPLTRVPSIRGVFVNLLSLVTGFDPP